MMMTTKQESMHLTHAYFSYRNLFYLFCIEHLFVLYHARDLGKLSKICSLESYMSL